MLELVNISKAVGEFVIRDVNLSVGRGDYLTLLGVSGAGKTMLLEIISGIIKPDSGKIILNNKDITKFPIQSRNFGIVYQNQALFPHMNVFANIAFPLKCRKKDKHYIEDVVNNIAAETEIRHLLDRNVVNLSGGESQRVAIARALATNPEILLLDEPLSFLDVNLKNDITALLRKINGKGQTIIHVTHNYKEAVLLSGRIGIVENGALIQVGHVKEVFNHPKSKFVANFLGIKNYYIGKITEEENVKYFVTNNVKLIAGNDAVCGGAYAWIRNNNVFILDEHNRSNFTNRFSCRINRIEPTSKGVEIFTDIGIPVCLYVNTSMFERDCLISGDEIEIGFRSEDICWESLNNS